MRRLFVLVTLLGACAVAASSVSAGIKPPTACKIKGSKTYPGDNAPKAEIAKWMAIHAYKAGLPPELPVMGALVESNLTNLDNGDSDAVGYFQMRISIWNSGPYAGFPDHPELQLQWFIDHALAIKQIRIAEGDPDFGLDETQWGEWVADVQRPAEEYRGRYQLRLADARALVCS